MSLMPKSASQWWQQKNSREQGTLVFLLVFLVASGLYVAVLEPVVGGNWEANSQHETADEEYQWLRQQIDVLNRIRAERGGILPTSLSASQLQKEIEKDFEKLKIFAEVRIVNKGGSKIVEIRLSPVNGFRIMQWLGTLANKGLDIRALDLENKGGSLSGTILLGGSNT